ncbi:MAG: sulfatase, partial [Planctomycetota bacterium]
MRDNFPVISLLCCAALLFASAIDSPAHASDGDEVSGRPNVLMIAIDDLNDWVQPLNGHPQVRTPAMQRLADRGMTFTNAHCQAPLCNPSRTSLLLSRRPSSTGIYGLRPFFRSVPEFQNEVTLPQHFHAAGYETLIGGKIFHGGDARPPRRSNKTSNAEADVWGPNAGVGIKPKQKLIPPTPGGDHPLMDWGTFPHSDEDKGDWKVADWAVQQLGRLENNRQPFFLSVGFFLPHVPCYVSKKWYDMYPEDILFMPCIVDGDRDDTPDSSWYIHWYLPEPRTKWLRETNQLRNLTRSYLASISFVDSQVGRVLDALESAGHGDDTIVVLWSDHGYHLGEKGISGKNSLWTRSTRVPLIVSIPPGISSVDQPPRSKCDQPVELLDIYPSLADLCGLEMLSQWEGQSLRPQLQNPAARRERPAITTHNADNHRVRSLRYRYIRYADGGEEFYDLENDPHELKNLASDSD